GLQFCGLLYPSLQMKVRADNVALFPHIVDAHLTLERVDYYEVETVNPDDSFQVKELDFATSFSADSLIEWKGRASHVVLKESGTYTATAENGIWVIRNEHGEIIECS